MKLKVRPLSTRLVLFLRKLYGKENVVHDVLEDSIVHLEKLHLLVHKEVKE